MIATYPTLEAFYAMNPARKRSPESDYGVMWQEAHRTWPQWRISYIQSTGEVYAVRLGKGSGDAVKVLGIVPADPVDDPVHGIWYVTLDRILDGWADVDVTHHMLAWVEHRLVLAREARA
jgi:hypothetical protein